MDSLQSFEMKICQTCGNQNPEDLQICLSCASKIGVFCPSCEQNIPVGNKYCGQCGYRLPLECPSCNTPMSDEYLYCPKCGVEIDQDALPQDSDTDVSEPGISTQDRLMKELRDRMPDALVNKIVIEAPELVGQRREVTVVFIDLANFTAASRKLDSEDIYLIVDEAMQYLADIIYKYEGTIDKFTGEGLMALFGLPIKHENDPERAVRAALEMQSVLAPMQKNIKQKHNLEFNIRIGVNTGSVIAGNLGSQHHMEYTVIGNTVNLASRLESLAKPGTTLVSFSTYQRTKPIIEYENMPPISIKGFPELVNTFSPLGLRIKPGQARGLPGVHVPMVGRLNDLRLLSETFLQVTEEKSSRIVLVSGMAGLGKTRLIAEFRQLLTSRPVKVFQGVCASYMRITPYRVIADLVRNMLNISEIEAENVQRQALQNRLELLSIDQREVLPYLLHLLSLSQTDPVIEARLSLLNPTMFQHQMHSALRTLIRAEALQQPTIAIFDDLHWVDPASTEFLSYLSQSLVDVPILLIFIARDFSENSITPMISGLQKQPKQPIEINLEPLTLAESRLLVNQLIQQSTVTAANLKEHIIESSGGNPYYVEELIRILMDRGGLTRFQGEWQFTLQAQDMMDEVPGTLQDIILARFDSLPENLRLTLQKATVLGRSFVIGLLQNMVSEDLQPLMNTLRDLEQRDFLLSTHFGSEMGYIFKHPLLRETIYSTLLKRDLHKLHYQVAQSIEAGTFWLPGERNEILAYHYSESTSPLAAIPYLIAAAENAAKRFANQAAVQHYRHAIKLMESLPDASVDQYIRVRIGLAQALKFTGELEEAVKMLSDSVLRMRADERYVSRQNPEYMTLLIDGLRELADIRSREGALDEAIEVLQSGMEVLGDSGKDKFPWHWRRLADRIAWVYFRQGKLEEAFSIADLACMNVNVWEADDPITLASLNNTLGGIFWMRSKLNEAIEYVEHSLEINKSLVYHWGTAIAYTNLGILHYSQGRWSEAVENLERADALRSEHGYATERPTSLKNLGELLMSMGNHRLAREKLLTSLDISQRLGMSLAAAYAEIGLARLSIIESKFSNAADHLKNARGYLATSPDVMDDRTVHILFLESLVQAEFGNLDEGLRLAHEARQIAEDVGLQSEKTETMRILGILYHQRGDFGQADDYLKKSNKLAQEQDDKYRLAQASYELGRLYLDMIKTETSVNGILLQKALGALDQAIHLFETLGARHDFQVAQTLRNSIPIDYSHGLTIIDENDTLVQVTDMRRRLSMPEGEWHQAVVIYIIISPRQEFVDEEFIFETIAILTPPITDIIHDNQGQVIRRQDGITVILGAPKASEDDPERAVQTAVLVMNFYQELYNQTELPVTLKIGISMGKLVAGYVGSPEVGEFIAAGEPIDQAKIIANAAVPASVWVSQGIRNATQHRFEYSSTRSELTVHLAGETISQLEGLREQIGPVRGLMGIKAPFIGREVELEAMDAMSEKLDQGIGGLVWIEGEPGMGKSRLMGEFSSRVANRGYLILNGNCASRRSDYAFSLFSNLLEQTFDIQSTLSTDEITQHLVKKLETWPPDLKDVLPFAQILAGVQPTGELGEQLAALEPEQLRRQMFVNIRRVISVLSTQQPLVLLFDDLQWIDPLSADLLLFLTNLITTHPVLIIGAQRTTESGTPQAALEHAQRLHPEQSIQLPIRPLSKTECQLLLDEFLGEAKLPAGVRALIVYQSGGNPYYIEEFVRLLIEQDYLRINRGRLDINQTLRIDTLRVPPSLEILIRSRVDAIPADAKELLQIASILGQTFERKLLAQVSGHLDLRKGLEILKVRGMLQSSDSEEDWQFSHPLIETTVYNSILKAQRRILHGRVARMLESQWHDSVAERAQDLAYHFNKAGENEKALHYLVLAGERATGRYANEEALAHYQQAVQLLTHLPETNDDLRWRLYSGLGDVYQLIGNYDSSIDALKTCLSLVDSKELTTAQRAGIYRRLGDTTQKVGDHESALAYLTQALHTLGSPQDTQAEVEAVRILTRMGWSYFLQGNHEQARKVSLKGLAFARKADNINALAMVENLLGGISYRQGNIKDALKHTHQAMSYWKNLGYGWGVAMGLNNLGILAVSGGNWPEAHSFFHQSLDLRKEMGDVEGVAITYNNLGSLARDQGNMDEAEEYFGNCLSVAKLFQLTFHAANSSMGLAQVLFYQGNPALAKETLYQGVEMAQEIDARDLLAEMHCVDAEILVDLGQYVKASDQAQKAVSMAVEIGNKVAEASAWRIFANCLYQQKQYKTALSYLDNAWEAISGGDDELETGRLHAQAGLLYDALEDHEQANGHFRAAKQIFSRLGASRDLDSIAS